MWNKENAKGNVKNIRRNKPVIRLNKPVVAFSVLTAVIFAVAVHLFFGGKNAKEVSGEMQALMPPAIQENFISPNEYSRPGTALTEIRGVVVHYTANPGTSALANRNYFNNLTRINAKKKNKTYASSHFVIGIDGEIVQCVPLNEIAYASNERNSDTISIECCHRKKSGRFTKNTYRSLVELVTYLCKRYGLKETDVIRHYDVTGKICPKYFVEHEDAWLNFRSDVATELEK